MQQLILMVETCHTIASFYSVYIFLQKKPRVAQNLESEGANYSFNLAIIYRRAQG